MPHYDYRCSACGHQEEILQKITEDQLEDCPQCKKATFIRQFGTGIGLQFQGSGFYCTDYGTSKPASSPKNESSPASSSNCGCDKTSCST